MRVLAYKAWTSFHKRWWRLEARSDVAAKRKAR
jgi:hypothetical protein